MKTIQFSALITCVIALTALCDTNSVAWPRHTGIPHFKPDMLESNVLQAAYRFRNASGTNRYDDAQILDRELAPGISLTEELDPKWLMTEDDVITLLGKPDGRKPGESIRYNIGTNRRGASALLFVFKNGYLHSIYEARTH